MKTLFSGMNKQQKWPKKRLHHVPAKNLGAEAGFFPRRGA